MNLISGFIVLKLLLLLLFLDGMDTEEGAKQKNLAMAKKKFNMDHKKVAN